MVTRLKRIEHSIECRACLFILTSAAWIMMLHIIYNGSKGTFFYLFALCCAAVIVFCIGVICYTAGKKIENGTIVPVENSVLYSIFPEVFIAFGAFCINQVVDKSLVYLYLLEDYSYGYYISISEHFRYAIEISVYCCATIFCISMIIALHRNGKMPKKITDFAIFAPLSKLWRKIKIGVGYIKSFFTGKVWNKYKLVKSFMISDIVFLATSLILLIVILECAFNYEGGIAFFAVLGQIAITAFYFIGKYSKLKSVALLENQIEKICDGEIISETDILRSTPFAKSSEHLYEISSNYKKNVDEKLKSERMKIELVANVSHDLKTPLTSVISYIDLLSKTELSPEAEDYVKILISKSARLRDIVSDVFELAKTTSGQLILQNERLDFGKLVIQTLADINDRITASSLNFKIRVLENTFFIESDGKRLYRVIQNLIDNVLKYSMDNTRVYISMSEANGFAQFCIRNTAAEEIEVTEQEILERFVRGDRARTTEGSGLGLSIAKGFTEACGGRFDLTIDGDLFKVTVEFPTKN